MDNIHLPIISALCAGILIILHTVLLIMVIRKRAQHEQGIGDGGHADLELAIRRHCNLTENAPIFIIALALLEMYLGSALSISIFGYSFVIGRVLHAAGLSLGGAPTAPRFIGMTTTMLCNFGVGGYLCYLAASSF